MRFYAPHTVFLALQTSPHVCAGGKLQGIEVLNMILSASLVLYTNSDGKTTPYCLLTSLEFDLQAPDEKV